MIIKVTDSFKDALYSMTDGNVGAAQCLASMLEFSPERGMNAMFTCSKHDFYGNELYELWNDICNRDPEMLIGIIEGMELESVGVKTQIPDSIKDILREIKEIAIKMTFSGEENDDVKKLMEGLDDGFITEEEALEILGQMKIGLETINRMRK